MSTASVVSMLPCPGQRPPSDRHRRRYRTEERLRLAGENRHDVGPTVRPAELHAHPGGVHLPGERLGRPQPRRVTALRRVAIRAPATTNSTTGRIRHRGSRPPGNASTCLTHRPAATGQFAGQRGVTIVVGVAPYPHTGSAAPGTGRVTRTPTPKTSTSTPTPTLAGPITTTYGGGGACRARNRPVTRWTRGRTPPRCSVGAPRETPPRCVSAATRTRHSEHLSTITSVGSIRPRGNGPLRAHLDVIHRGPLAKTWPPRSAHRRQPDPCLAAPHRYPRASPTCSPDNDTTAVGTEQGLWDDSRARFTQARAPLAPRAPPARDAPGGSTELARREWFRPRLRETLSAPKRPPGMGRAPDSARRASWPTGRLHCRPSRRWGRRCRDARPGMVFPPAPAVVRSPDVHRQQPDGQIVARAGTVTGTPGLGYPGRGRRRDPHRGAAHLGACTTSLVHTERATEHRPASEDALRAGTGGWLPDLTPHHRLPFRSRTSDLLPPYAIAGRVQQVGRYGSESDFHRNPPADLFALTVAHDGGWQHSTHQCRSPPPCTARGTGTSRCCDVSRWPAPATRVVERAQGQIPHPSLLSPRRLRSDCCCGDHVFHQVSGPPASAVPSTILAAPVR